MKKVIIVGAGISGLTAGIYALKSGFDVTIYESHTIPGGASTSWRRKGYLFEGGLHWLTGSSSKTFLNEIWREVGALEDTTSIYNKDPFLALEYNGQTAYLYRDIEKLRQHFLEISPEDRKEINRLCKDVRKFTKMEMPITNIKGVKIKKKTSVPIARLLGMLPALPRIPFYAKQTSAEYAKRYKSPLLQQLIQNIVGAENSASGLVFTLSTLASGDGGYPEGGSLSMANRMAKRFKDLGGVIVYGKAVNKVLVKEGVALGIIVGEEEIAADAVIISQDTLVAIDTLFEKPIHEPWAEKMRSHTIPMLNTFISLGIRADLSDIPESIAFKAEVPIICAGEKISFLGMNNYAGYKGYAPEGCTAVTMAIMGDSYEYWKACKEKGTYEEEKIRLAEDYIAALEKKYPQIKGKVEVWDVATPLTYERYLGSFKGSWMSVMRKGDKMTSYPSKPESIQNVYFAGQRLISPGGLPVAAMTGRTAVQYLCKDMNTIFQGR